jgi:hypothetical protein
VAGFGVSLLIVDVVLNVIPGYVFIALGVVGLFIILDVKSALLYIVLMAANGGVILLTLRVAGELDRTMVSPFATLGRRALMAALCFGLPAIVVSTRRNILALVRATTAFIRTREVFTTVVGFVVTYVALIFAYALAFAGIYLANGAASFKTDRPPKLTDFCYFSAVTATTLGYGDIVPIDPSAKLLAITEAVGGVILVGLYLGVIIGSIVPTLSIRQPDTDGPVK